MIYFGEHQVSIENTNYIDNVAILNLPTGEIVCIPIDGANESEIDIIQQIRDDVESRPVPEIIEPVYTPTPEEKLRADIDYLSAMMGVEL